MFYFNAVFGVQVACYNYLLGVCFFDDVVDVVDVAKDVLSVNDAATEAWVVINEAYGIPGAGAEEALGGGCGYHTEAFAGAVNECAEATLVAEAHCFGGGEDA